ncbi:MAG: glucosaminidase domain-containing protein [Bacteroidota bacterium]|nr:glucosaminidase domain-containing protein [Bacteroidota bacterium]
MRIYAKRSLCLFLISVFLFLCGCEPERVDVIHKKLKSADDIVPLDSILVKPFDYTNVVSLDNFPVEIKKQKFVDMLLPAILVAKIHTADKLQKLEEFSSKDSAEISMQDERFIRDLMLEYRADNLRQLKRKLNTPPNSIVLGQAALESGWGTSRFFLEANNVFGIWSFDKEEPRVQARILRGDKAVYLKKYDFLSESIEDYFKTIARGPYRDFRIENAESANPYKLIPLLRRYSENDSIYEMRLKYVIRFNDLDQYDEYRIDPEYLNN